MAEEDKELEEFFGVESDEEVESVDEAEAEEEAQVETEEEAETEESEEAEPEESEPTADKESDSVPRAALLDERRKRQAMEKRLAELESRLPQEEEETPDPILDREGYEAYLRKKWETEQVQKAEKDRMKKIEDRRTSMLEEHDDFLEKERIFEILSVRDPNINREMLESNDPVGYAYEKATTYYNEVMSPKQVLSEEMPTETETAPKSKKPNLAKATADASNSVQVEKEPVLDDVFADIDY